MRPKRIMLIGEKNEYIYKVKIYFIRWRGGGGVKNNLDMPKIKLNVLVLP